MGGCKGAHLQPCQQGDASPDDQNGNNAGAVSGQQAVRGARVPQGGKKLLQDTWGLNQGVHQGVHLAAQDLAGRKGVAKAALRGGCIRRQNGDIMHEPRNRVRAMQDGYEARVKRFHFLQQWG